MAITTHNLMKHELIGQTAEVVSSKNPSLKGIKGEIIDETRSTLTIMHEKTAKKLLKSAITLKLTINGETIEVDGEKLLGRPEDRLKK